MDNNNDDSHKKRKGEAEKIRDKNKKKTVLGIKH